MKVKVEFSNLENLRNVIYIAILFMFTYVLLFSLWCHNFEVRFKLRGGLWALYTKQ